MNITQALPTAEAILQLEPEELGSYLLEHLAGHSNHLHLENLLGAGIGDTLMKHYKQDERVEEALREAWAWLEREGLIVRKQYGHFISRRGKRIRSRQDFNAYCRSNVLPRASLHPVLAERVWPNFVRGDYETAVFQAFKEVEILVRAAGKYATTEIGTVLVGKAFKARVGPLTDTTLPEAEQLAMLNLFLGAVGLFKNPSSHRHIALIEPGDPAGDDRLCELADANCGCA